MQGEEEECTISEYDREWNFEESVCATASQRAVGVCESVMRETERDERCGCGYNPEVYAREPRECIPIVLARAVICRVCGNERVRSCPPRIVR